MIEPDEFSLAMAGHCLALIKWLAIIGLYFVMYFLGYGEPEK